MCVWRNAEFNRTTAEDFCLCAKLHVYFQPNHWLVLREHLTRSNTRGHLLIVRAKWPIGKGRNRTAKPLACGCGRIFGCLSLFVFYVFLVVIVQIFIIFVFQVFIVLAAFRVEIV